jgi:hypothetical protein
MDPTSDQLRILRNEPSHGIAFTGRTLVVHWQTETHASAVIELATLLASLAAECGSLALLQVIGEKAIPPDGSARAALASMLKSNEARIIASAVVFEATGFRAALIRSIVSSISMLSGHKCAHVVFGSTTEGIEWLRAQIKANAGAHQSADSLQVAIAQLRERARVASN